MRTADNNEQGLIQTLALLMRQRHDLTTELNATKDKGEADLIKLKLEALKEAQAQLREQAKQSGLKSGPISDILKQAHRAASIDENAADLLGNRRVHIAPPLYRKSPSSGGPTVPPDPPGLEGADELPDEQRLMYDFEFFCSFLMIKYRPGLNPAAPNQMQGPFILNDEQRRIISIYIRVLFIEKRPLRVQELKRRQLGCTTLNLAFFTWMMIKFHKWNWMIIIDKDAHAHTKKIRFIEWIKSLKARFPNLPGIKTGGSSSKSIQLENDSWAFFESGQSTNPGTSENLNALLESEKPKWKPGRAVYVATSVVPAIADAPLTIHVDESTAMGADEFQRKWFRVTRVTSGGIIAIFLPWQASLEYTLPPGPQDYDEHGRFRYWDHDPQVCDYDNEQERDLFESEYARKYGLSDGQILWRRHKIKHTMEGRRDLFDQEYPTSDEHAFRVVQIGYYSPRLLDYLRKREVVAQRFTLFDENGHEDLGRIPSYSELSPGLLPSSQGELLIRHKPEAGVRYFIGLDVAEGRQIEDDSGRLDPDWSVASVKDQYGVTVAVLITRMPVEHLWFPVLLLCLYYNEAWLNGERNSVGGAVLTDILRARYHRRVWSTPARPNSNSRFEDRCWTYVSRGNKAQIVSGLRRSFTIDNNRPFLFSNHQETTLKQLAAYIQKSDGQLTAAPGFHDDILSAEAMAELMRINFVDELTVSKPAPPPPVIHSLPIEVPAYRLSDTDLSDNLSTLVPGWS